jgi:hypothetical protein
LPYGKNGTPNGHIKYFSASIIFFGTTKIPVTPLAARANKG